MPLACTWSYVWIPGPDNIDSAGELIQFAAIILGFCHQMHIHIHIHAYIFKCCRVVRWHTALRLVIHPQVGKIPKLPTPRHSGGARSGALRGCTTRRNHHQHHHFVLRWVPEITCDRRVNGMVTFLDLLGLRKFSKDFRGSWSLETISLGDITYLILAHKSTK